MTKISFEATYDIPTLHKMKVAELSGIWMKVCSPPKLKDQLIREILHFQKKNRLDELQLQNIRKTDSNSKSDVQATMLEASFERRPLPRLEHVLKSNDTPKRKSATTRRGASNSISGKKSRLSESRNIRRRKFTSSIPKKNSVFSKLSSDESDNESIANKPSVGRPQLKSQSHSAGFLRWIIGSEKMEKKSDQDIDHVVSKNIHGITERKHGSQGSLLSKPRVKPRPFSSVMHQSNNQNAEILNVDIQLDGLDAIPDIEKQRELSKQGSSVLKIRAPSNRVLIDNFETLI